jgi:hypothetical protein
MSTAIVTMSIDNRALDVKLIIILCLQIMPGLAIGNFMCSMCCISLDDAVILISSSDT